MNSRDVSQSVYLHPIWMLICCEEHSARNEAYFSVISYSEINDLEFGIPNFSEFNQSIDSSLG